MLLLLPPAEQAPLVARSTKWFGRTRITPNSFRARVGGVAGYLRTGDEVSFFTHTHGAGCRELCTPRPPRRLLLTDTAAPAPLPPCDAFRSLSQVRPLPPRSRKTHALLPIPQLAPREPASDALCPSLIDCRAFDCMPGALPHSATYNVNNMNMKQCGLLLALALGSADGQGLQAARPGRGNLFAAATKGPFVAPGDDQIYNAMGHNTTASGVYSTAMGASTTASGLAATAMGYFSTASGGFSTAMGYHVTASGDRSTAMGYSTKASGDGSTAMGYETTASGKYSTAMGDGTTAAGYGSTAMGSFTNASGASSTAMGDSTTASGTDSTAMGIGTTASGEYSTAMGYGTKAESFYETVVGRYNALGNSPSTHSWAATDAVFRVGTGELNDRRQDALTVYKVQSYSLYVTLG